MADISYSKTMTVRRNSLTVVSAGATGYKPIVHTATIELTASASGSTIKVGRFPSNARINLHSQAYWDDLATSGSPTLDIGVASVNNNITSDPDALNDGLNLSSAASSSRVVKDIANCGKQLWEYVNGQTSDPKGELDIYLSVVDAATNATGTITTEITYTVD